MFWYCLTHDILHLSLTHLMLQRSHLCDTVRRQIWLIMTQTKSILVHSSYKFDLNHIVSFLLAITESFHKMNRIIVTFVVLMVTVTTQGKRFS